MSGVQQQQAVSGEAAARPPLTLVDRDRRDVATTALEDRASRSRLAFWCVAAVFLVVMTGTTLPSPLFGLYEQRLHISSLSVTVIYGIYSVGVVTALAVLARFGAGIGLRTRLAAGLALSALSAALFLITTSLGLLIAARVLSGLAAGLTSGSATSAMIELGGKHRRARSAVIAVAVSFGGLAVGSATSGALSDLGSAALTLPFLIDLITSLAITPALLAIASGFNDSAPTDSITEDALARDGLDRGSSDAPFSSPRIRRLFIQATVPGGVGFAANGLVAAVAAVFLSGYLHLSNRALAGLVLAILFLATAGGQLIVRRASSRLAPILGSSGLIAGLTLLAITLLAPNLPGLIAAAIVIGASAGICTGAGLVSLAIAVPKSQLTKMTSVYYIALYGSVTIPVIGDGLIAQSTGITTAGLIVCALLAATVGAVLITLVRDRTSTPASGSQRLRGDSERSVDSLSTPRFSA
jgi:MFS family permease